MQGLWSILTRYPQLDRDSVQGYWHSPFPSFVPNSSFLNVSSNLRCSTERRMGRWDLRRNLKTFWDTLPLGSLSWICRPSMVCSGKTLYKCSHVSICIQDLWRHVKRTSNIAAFRDSRWIEALLSSSICLFVETQTWYRSLAGIAYGLPFAWPFASLLAEQNLELNDKPLCMHSLPCSEHWTCIEYSSPNGRVL